MSLTLPVRYFQRMSATVSESYGLAVAAEIRAWMGRRGINQRRLSDLMGTNEIWTSRRLHGKTSLGVEDLARFARALDVEIADLLPRLDSNQQPFGDTYALVSGSLEAA